MNAAGSSIEFVTFLLGHRRWRSFKIGLFHPPQPEVFAPTRLGERTLRFLGGLLYAASFIKPTCHGPCNWRFGYRAC